MSVKPSWQRHQDKKKWQSLLSLFLTIAILFVIVNGLVRGISLKRQGNGFRWDGGSPLAIALNTKNPAIFIYEPDSKKVSVLAIDSETVYETGRIEKPLEKISETLNSGQNFARVMSLAYGAKIEGFIKLSDSHNINEKSAKEMLLNFASPFSPFKILTGEVFNKTESNITRSDAFRLWWQIKNIGANELIFTDLSNYREEIITPSGAKVLGVDTVSLNRVISKYLQNFDISKTDLNIVINNASGKKEAGALAVSFIKSVGITASRVENNDTTFEKTQIISKKKDFAASYLAKMFNCDINEAPNFQNMADSEIIVTLGTDFALRYFE